MRRAPLWKLLVVTTCCVCALAVSRLEAQELEFRPRVVIRRPFPAIKTPPFLAAKDVGDSIDGGELVLGVVVNDKPRAYPINMITGPRREIINDTLGGRFIAATW